jgi:hypothetical protein
MSKQFGNSLSYDKTTFSVKNCARFYIISPRDGLRVEQATLTIV